MRLFCRREPSVLFYNASGFIISPYSLILTYNVIRIYHESCWRQLSHCCLHVRAVSVFRKKSDAICGFLAYFCAVLRFSDPPYAPLQYSHRELDYTSQNCQSKNNSDWFAVGSRQLSVTRYSEKLCFVQWFIIILSTLSEEFARLVGKIAVKWGDFSNIKKNFLPSTFPQLHQGPHFLTCGYH